MMFTMLVALYTSRVVLQVLGVEDFGIYQTVGGVVMMLSSVNGALSTGSSRFLTYELGRGDTEKLQKNILHHADNSYYSRTADSIGCRNFWFVVCI